MAPLFEQWVGVDSFLCNVLKSTLLRLPSRVREKWHKTCGKPGPNYGTLNPSILFLNLFNLYLSHMNLYLPGIADFIGLFFCFWTRATFETLDPTLVWKKARKTSTPNLVHCTLNIPPPGVPLFPSGQFSRCYWPCPAAIYPYQHGG